MTLTAVVGHQHRVCLPLKAYFARTQRHGLAIDLEAFLGFCSVCDMAVVIDEQTRKSAQPLAGCSQTRRLGEGCVRRLAAILGYPRVGERYSGRAGLESHGHQESWGAAVSLSPCVRGKARNGSKGVVYAVPRVGWLKYRELLPEACCCRRMPYFSLQRMLVENTRQYCVLTTVFPSAYT